MERQYSVSKGKSVLLITGAIIVLFVAITLVNFFEYNQVENAAESALRNFIASGIFGILLIVSWLFSVTSYTLTQEHLIINRPVGSKKIAIAEIVAAKTVTKHEIGAMIRKFGNGGLFGYYGTFGSFNLGTLHYFATRRDNQVLIILKNSKKYVISPDNLHLVDDLNARLNRSYFPTV